MGEVQGVDLGGAAAGGAGGGCQQGRRWRCSCCRRGGGGRRATRAPGTRRACTLASVLSVLLQPPRAGPGQRLRPLLDTMAPPGHSPATPHSHPWEATTTPLLLLLLVHRLRRAPYEVRGRGAANYLSVRGWGGTRGLGTASGPTPVPPARAGAAASGFGSGCPLLGLGRVREVPHLCVCVCARARVCACVHVCVCACVCVCVCGSRTHLCAQLRQPVMHVYFAHSHTGIHIHTTRLDHAILVPAASTDSEIWYITYINTCMHTHIHTCTHTHMHAVMHLHLRTRLDHAILVPAANTSYVYVRYSRASSQHRLANVHTVHNIRACMHGYAHSYMHTCMQACTYTYTHVDSTHLHHAVLRASSQHRLRNFHAVHGAAPRLQLPASIVRIYKYIYTRSIPYI